MVLNGKPFSTVSESGPRVCPKPKSNPTGSLDGEVFIFGAERKTIQYRFREWAPGVSEAQIQPNRLVRR